MRVGFYQFQPAFHDPKANLDRVAARLEATAADLVVLPELCLSGYLFASRAELARFAEPVPDGPSCRALASLCRRRGMNLVFGIAEQAGDRLYNSAVLVTRDGDCRVWRKAHLFLDEKDVFDPGDLAFPVFEVDGVKVGMLVCFDYIFPESARSLALHGARIICHPANLVLDYAQSMTLTRTIENRVFWILANRTGQETLGAKSLSFTGRSQVAAPGGRLLYRAGLAGEELPVIDIDPSEADDKLATPRNHLLDDRRTDLYAR